MGGETYESKEVLMNILYLFLIITCGIKAGVDFVKEKEVEGVLWLIVMWLVAIYSTMKIGWVK